MDRLTTLDPALPDAIAALPDDATRRARARALAESVAGRLGIHDEPAIRRALAADRPDDAAVAAVSELVDRLDQSAWDLQDAGDDDAYLRRFSEARAANAVLDWAGGGADGNLGDVVYEAHAATGDLPYVRDFVRA